MKTVWNGKSAEFATVGLFGKGASGQILQVHCLEIKYMPAFKVFISKYSSILVDTISHLAKSLFWLQK